MSHVAQCLADRPGPVVAATDYIRLNADQIRGFFKQRYVVLGTDGFGRSATREQLRQFFEVDRYYIVLAALYALQAEGSVTSQEIEQALARYSIDPKKPNPFEV
ncbi:transketolase-like TK C-terminal-containing protein [Rickettsiella massiliensis]|uniref:transketolase-like TK C-terminal-containing protein n=1 Tax=Rickettsiella massiliensis TaxID=676517 RepID=UPI00029B02A2